MAAELIMQKTRQMLKRFYHHNTMYTKKLFGLFPIHCERVNCSDEVFGALAIILGVIGFLLQLRKTATSYDVESFSIYALFVLALSELMFAVQAYMKKSYSLILTRTATFIGAVIYIVIWFRAQSAPGGARTDWQHYSPQEGH